MRRLLGLVVFESGWELNVEARQDKLQCLV